jgi:hypothetical protein
MTNDPNINAPPSMRGEGIDEIDSHSFQALAAEEASRKQALRKKAE